jgi:hypothetical protein
LLHGASVKGVLEPGSAPGRLTKSLPVIIPSLDFDSSTFQFNQPFFIILNLAEGVLFLA